MVIKYNPNSATSIVGAVIDAITTTEKVEFKKDGSKGRGLLALFKSKNKQATGSRENKSVFGPLFILGRIPKIVLALSKEKGAKNFMSDHKDDLAAGIVNQYGDIDKNMNSFLQLKNIVDHGSQLPNETLDNLIGIGRTERVKQGDGLEAALEEIKDLRVLSDGLVSERLIVDKKADDLKGKIKVLNETNQNLKKEILDNKEATKIAGLTVTKLNKTVAAKDKIIETLEKNVKKLAKK